MQRVLSILIIFGIIVWGFLLWERTQPITEIEQMTGHIDNTDTADRCAHYRMPVGEDASTWSLGYEGRIRQLIHGCF